MSERSLRGVVVSPDMFQTFITRGAMSHVKCVEGLPLGAKARYSYMDVKYDYVVLVYEHESFDEVKLGDTIPLMTAKFEVIR